VSDDDVIVIEILPPWKMYFNGAAHYEGTRAGVIFITPDGDVLPYSFTLTKLCFNNVAEYKTFILELELVVDMKQLHLRVYGDSKLIIYQILGEYNVKKYELILYYNYERRLMGYLVMQQFSKY
jgi:ribonuclease HI